VVLKEIQLAHHLDDLKRDMQSRPDYSTVAAYRSIDKYNDGSITQINLGTFLKSCGHFSTGVELH
jgi:hypothetical protein